MWAGQPGGAGRRADDPRDNRRRNQHPRVELRVMNEAWDAESPIRQDRWPDFQKLYHAMWDQLVYLRTSLFLLRELAEFPLHRFAAPDDQWFFTIVRRSLLESVVLTITKLTTDQGNGVLTLMRCRNLVQDMLREELVPKFREDLKNTGFNKFTETLAGRARDLRDGRVAHLLQAEVTNASAIRLTLPELERLVNDTERLFQPLLFGGEATFLPLPYDRDVREANPPRVTDVEKILNAFARQSHVLNYPEQVADLWPRLRNDWPVAELEQFNRWRVRAGLPEA